MSGSILEDRRTDCGFDLDQLVRDARVHRIGVALAVVGAFHLLIFAGCEFLFLRGDRSANHFLPLWILDATFALLLLRRKIKAMGLLDSARAVRVVTRIWLTFLILCLTSASLNSITGFAIDWFKISWAMLGTFAFATLSWIFHLAFLIPAVLWSVTALLIAAHPDHAYAIFGVAWFLTLEGFALLLEADRLRERCGLRPAHRRQRLIFQRQSQEV